jgi:FkbM family methyltransferase
MTFVSYAQNFEDVLLWRALNDVTDGRYIDIGAQDPIVDSVSQAFYEAGWRGMHVEPQPKYAARLRDARPDEPVVEAAVTDVSGPLLFYELDGLSSGCETVAQHHIRSGLEPRQMFVPTVRLDRLLTTIDAEIHWMKIDVEGMEADVLRSWGDCPIRPWLLLIESTFPNSQEPQQHLWIEEVAKRDYREIFFDGLSRFFVHESQSHRDAAFAAPANVFDGFAVTAQHFSAACMRTEIEDAEIRLRNGLADAAAARDAAQESAAAAIESEQQARDELAAAAAKEAALVTRMLDAEREHGAAIDGLWRERAAAEAKRSKEFRAATEKLRAALDDSRRGDSAARAELARSNERAKALERELTRRQAEHERFRREGKDERDLHLQRLGAAQAAEADARAELARASEKAGHLERELVSAKQEHDRIRTGLETELQQHRSALARADALIRETGRHPARAWDRVGRSLGLSGGQAVARALSDWTVASALHPKPTDAPDIGNENHGLLPQAAEMSGGDPYLRANSLVELLAWDDVDFVRCAYVTILGRQPDAEGEAYYTDRIRRGHSKMEVLWQLRRSPEGREHDPGIAGLDRELRRARRARMRLIGGAFRFFNQEEGDGARDRRARATANEIAMLRAVEETALTELRSLGSDLRNLRNLIEAVGAKTSVAGCASAQVGSESASARGILDPIDLDSARDPDEVIDTLRAAINSSREVAAFRSGRQSPQ